MIIKDLKEETLIIIEIKSRFLTPMVHKGILMHQLDKIIKKLENNYKITFISQEI